MPSVTHSGESSSKLPASGGAAYPCVRRLRHRCLLNSLRVEGLDAAFASMAGETDACLSVEHMQRLVERGQWKDAVGYLSRFVPPELGRLGLEAQVLHRFLAAHMWLAHIIAGTREGDVLAARYSAYLNHGSSELHGVIRLRSIVLTALHARQQLRTSIDWERVRRKVSEIVNDVAYRTPELKGLLLMPSDLSKGHDVHSISFSPQRRYHGKKQSRRPRASILAKSYLRKKSLLSSSHSQESCDELMNKALNCVADAVDECLKAGKRPELHQTHPLQPNVMKGATFPPAHRTSFSTTAGPVMYPRMLYVANAGKFARNVPTTGAPTLGTMIGVPQTVFGCLTNPDKGSGMSLMTDADVGDSNSSFGRQLQHEPFSIFTIMPSASKNF